MRTTLTTGDRVKLRHAVHDWRQAADGPSTDDEHNAARELAESVEAVLKAARAATTLDTASSASRQHYIETGEYLAASDTEADRIKDELFAEYVAGKRDQLPKGDDLAREIAARRKGPFHLDEDRARAWLTAVVANVQHDVPMPAEFAAVDVPEITSVWNAADVKPSVAMWDDLTHGARQLDVITGPGELYVWVEYDTDYRVAFRVTPGPVAAYLASQADQLVIFGDRDATGVEAAVSVLADIVKEANRIANAVGVAAN